MSGGAGRGPRVFFGWYVLAASFAILFLNTGARTAIGVMVKPMAAEFGWSRGAISSAIFLNLAVYAVATILTGRLYDRFGPKWVIVISSLFFSAGTALMATMGSLWQFLLYYGVISAAGLGGVTVPIFGSIMGRWFDRRRGLAVSLAFAGSCLGQFFLVPVFSDIVLVSGWRPANVWIAALSLALNLPLALGVIRGDPKHFGLAAYGTVPRPSPDGSASGTVSGSVKAPLTRPGPGRTLSEAMRTRSLWLFTVVMFVCGAGDFLVLTHLVAMVTDYGVSPSTAAGMLAWVGLLSLGGILLAGPAADAIGNKIPIAATFAFRVLLFALLFSFKGPVSFWFFSLAFGFTLYITAPLTPTLLARLYGVTHLGFISGFVVMAHTIGGGVWSYLGGAVFDFAGDYDLALIISAATAALAFVCTLFIRERPHEPERRAGLDGLSGAAQAKETASR